MSTRSPGRRRPTVVLLATWALVCAATFLASPYVVDRAVNRVHESRSELVAAPATRMPIVVDLHADSLLWPRDLLTRGTRGHVDVPRLVEGGVAVQVFGLVTKVPLIPSLERNDGDTDMLMLHTTASRWPRRTWSSPLERALFQAHRLEALAAASDGRLAVVRTRHDLESVLARRAAGDTVIAAILAVEGAHAIEGALDNVDRLYDAGVRMMSPSHFFDTRVGGSAHGMVKGGLTELGRAVIRRMETLGMTVDLAHASPVTIRDAAAIAARPLVASHTGVKGTCDHTRNLDDDAVRLIAASDGVVGIGYWETAVCGRDVAAIVRAIRYTADLVGHRHVALGSDFDGAVAVPFDTSGLPRLYAALITDGFSREQAADIMGGNALRVLRRNLPSSG